MSTYCILSKFKTKLPLIFTHDKYKRKGSASEAHKTSQQEDTVYVVKMHFGI